MTDQTLFAFDAATLNRVAGITYHADGRVVAQFEDGTLDQGRWGISDSQYWTRYDNFREGSTNSFYLEWIAQDTVQAFFADGTRAFVQSPDADFGTRP